MAENLTLQPLHELSQTLLEDYETAVLVVFKREGPVTQVGNIIVNADGSLPDLPKVHELMQLHFGAVPTRLKGN